MPGDEFNPPVSFKNEREALASRDFKKFLPYILPKMALGDEEKDPITALAEKYLSTPCSCMTPNNGRLDLIGRLAREYDVDGVVDLTWQACHTYNIESFTVKKFVQEELNLPFIQIETDYSDSDTGQVKVRVEAFLETIERPATAK